MRPKRSRVIKECLIKVARVKARLGVSGGLVVMGGGRDAGVLLTHSLLTFIVLFSQSFS